MELSSVISRVQKLLALSTSSNANEAAIAAAKANKLIDEYRLTESELNVNNPNNDPLIEDDSYIYETGRIIPWKNYLVSVLTDHYGCTCFNQFIAPKGRKISQYKLIGKKSDVQIVKYMFTWLMNECQRLSDIHAKGKGHVYVFSYCEGFVAGIKRQLELSRKELQQATHSSAAAMVLLDSRKSEAELFMNKLYKLKANKGSSARRLNSEAFMNGKIQGENFDIDKATKTTVNNKLLS